MLDRFAALGKPVVISRMGVPSIQTDKNAAAGLWRKPWNDQLQSKWLEALSNIVLSKPFVEAMTWAEVVDSETGSMPGGGLLTADLSAKPSMQTWLAMRRAVLAVRQGAQKTPAAGAAAANKVVPGTTA